MGRLAGSGSSRPDGLDGRLLAAVEQAVPLAPRPYAAIAESVGASQEDVLRRLAALRGPRGPIREISALFDAAALGYRQALVAMAVPDAQAAAAGALAASHPGVSHCYRRSGRYNIWFTLAVSPASGLGLEGTAELIACRGSATAHMLLPTRKRYKLAVRLAAAEDVPLPAEGTAGEAGSLTAAQRAAVRALQADLPNVPEPFAPLAAAAGMATDALLAVAAEFRAAGWMRRYAAVLRHRRAGAVENVLAAWKVGEDAADRAGAAAAAFREVSHCYLRPAGADWPYRLYTMIHGADRAACRVTLAAVAAAANLPPPAELWTLEEYKKRRAILFTDDEAAWERRNA